MHNAQRMTCRWETSERVSCCFVEVCAGRFTLESPQRRVPVARYATFFAKVAANRDHLWHFRSACVTGGNTGTK